MAARWAAWGVSRIQRCCSSVRGSRGSGAAPAGVMVLTKGLYITISGMARSYAALALPRRLVRVKWERGGLPSCQSAKLLSTFWKSAARSSDAGTSTSSPQWALLVASRSMLFWPMPFAFLAAMRLSYRVPKVASACSGSMPLLTAERKSSAAALASRRVEP